MQEIGRSEAAEKVNIWRERVKQNWRQCRLVAAVIEPLTFMAPDRQKWNKSLELEPLRPPPSYHHNIRRIQFLKFNFQTN